MPLVATINDTVSFLQVTGQGFNGLVNRLENRPIGSSANLVGGEGSLVSLSWSFKMCEENQTGPPKFRPCFSNLVYKPLSLPYGGPISPYRLWRARQIIGVSCRPSNSFLYPCHCQSLCSFLSCDSESKEIEYPINHRSQLAHYDDH